MLAQGSKLRSQTSLLSLLVLGCCLGWHLYLKGSGDPLLSPAGGQQHCFISTPPWCSSPLAHGKAFFGRSCHQACDSMARPPSPIVQPWCLLPSEMKRWPSAQGICHCMGWCSFLVNSVSDPQYCPVMSHLTALWLLSHWFLWLFLAWDLPCMWPWTTLPPTSEGRSLSSTCPPSLFPWQLWAGGSS